jgi:hypothetical protein
MHRVPKNNQLRKDLAEWKGVQWTLTLDINGRMVITHAAASAVKRMGPDLVAYGHAADHLDPFDDLRAKLTDLLVESAMNAVDDLIKGEQYQLPLGLDLGE